MIKNKNCKFFCRNFQKKIKMEEKAPRRFGKTVNVGVFWAIDDPNFIIKNMCEFSKRRIMRVHDTLNYVTDFNSYLKFRLSDETKYTEKLSKIVKEWNYGALIFPCNCGKMYSEDRGDKLFVETQTFCQLCKKMFGWCSKECKKKYKKQHQQRCKDYDQLLKNNEH